METCVEFGGDRFMTEDVYSSADIQMKPISVYSIRVIFYGIFVRAVLRKSNEINVG